MYMLFIYKSMLPINGIIDPSATYEPNYSNSTFSIPHTTEEAEEQIAPQNLQKTSLSVPPQMQAD